MCRHTAGLAAPSAQNAPPPPTTHHLPPMFLLMLQKNRSVRMQFGCFWKYIKEEEEEEEEKKKENKNPVYSLNKEK